MRLSWFVSLTAISFAPLVEGAGQILIRNGVIGIVHHTGEPRLVENSGIYETTPGVYQALRYGDISANESILVVTISWYFDARNSPATAPLTLWFNDGPGSSGMLDAFHELGPCRISNELNPFSWNTNAKVLFINQPVGVGFSLHKILPYEPNLHKYGGHYGPTFTTYFLTQNAAISAGNVDGLTLNFETLCIDDGLTVSD
ncbi:Alpha/Beta hydrolase protein [Mycena sanguinolenta]|nr:Alpha/Beta hydrolase protein [Mycena sanguinolenta]